MDSFFTLRPTVRPGASYSLVSRSLQVSAPTGQSERVTVLERELEEARAELSSLRLARVSEREESAARVESMRSTCITTVWRWRIFIATWRLREGMSPLSAR